jgi:hypothetical protein
MEVTVNPARLHFFDAATGERLPVAAPAEELAAAP